MALFKKNDPQPAKPRERAAPASSSRGQPEAAISIIASGMSVVGDISTEGTVRVEGQVEGTIRAGRAVVLGQGGTVDGNILTEDAVIGGRVSGSVVATNRLELQSTCSVEGEISTRSEHLKLEEGARFDGHVKMIEEETVVPETYETPEIEEDPPYETHMIADTNDFEEEIEVLDLEKEEDEEAETAKN